ncbi:MAG: myo-inositol-1-phosphate synthase [Phycisphaerales bacterium]|nr:MAG: myo-inositol-1-phosphate synthase [Phycisphaerales bacterium]
MTTGHRVGLWLIGACGSIGSSVALGLAAMRRGLCGHEGLVSQLPVFKGADLVPLEAIVFGGHEVRDVTLVDAIQESHARAALFDADLMHPCADDLTAMHAAVRGGSVLGATPAVRVMLDQSAVRPQARNIELTPRDAVNRLADDLRRFRADHGLAHVVVINVSSCESNHEASEALHGRGELDAILASRSEGVLTTSSIYALAAVEAGCAYVNFTPSLGISAPAIRARADERGVPYMGCDGKTGETLVKSVLAPMFALRNLKVLSWVGHNILGNRDGQVLADARTRAAKIKSKDSTISDVVGYKPATHTSIEFIPSLDDWKVAWDFIHFQGFLGTKMNMQFTWQGSDSMLAAPLVIDLARFAELELRRGAGGPMKHLACFFKSPMDVAERDYFTQWTRLVRHVGGAMD